MCDPVTLTVTALALGAAGGGLAAYGANEEGKATNKYYQYLADQNEVEAQSAIRAGEQKTTIAQNEAAKTSADLKRDVMTTQGAQKAALAASGVTGGATASDIAVDTLSKSKLDEMAIRYNANATSWGVNEEAKNNAWALRSQGESYRMAGKNAKKAGQIKAVSSLLSTASSTAMGGADLMQAKKGK